MDNMIIEKQELKIKAPNQLDWKWKVIWNNLDPQINQQTDRSKAELFAALQYELANEEIRVFGIKDYKTVVVVRPVSQFVCEVHIFSDAHQFGKAVRGFRKIKDFIWNTTPYQRIEARSHLSKVGALAKRLGFELEGVRKDAYFCEDGTRLDEYEYGLNKPEGK